MLYPNRIAALVLTSAIAAFVSGGALAAPVTWSGATNSNMMVGTNWAGDIAPGPADQVQLNLASGNQPLLFASDNLTVAGTSIHAGTMTIAGTLTSPSVSTIPMGSLFLGQGGVIQGNVINAGTFTLNGTLGGTLDTFGRLRLGVDSTGAPLGSFASLSSATANLAGALEVNLSGLSYGANTITLDLIQAKVISGTFAVLDLLGLNSAYLAAASVVDEAIDKFRLVLTRTGPLPPAPGVAFDGDTSSNMTIGTNWQGDVRPGPSENAVLDTAGLLARLAVGDALTFGTTRISAGTMTIDGDLTSASVFTSGAGSLVLGSGGSIIGDVVNDGIFRLDGTLVGSLSTSGRLRVAVGSTGAPLWTLLANALELGGILELDLGGLGYGADSIMLDLFAAQTINGNFTSLELAGLDSAYGYSSSFIEGDGGDDVFRLVLSRSDPMMVPTPGTAPLVGIALLALLALRRRANSAFAKRSTAVAQPR